ncbi:MAG TPA: helix-turn-helix domain-containing protein [Jatrophihabitantaceae bacterium]|nr:helix-turn-helix domain-containing protein [Jatrophihabitantaceae bacterium]
MVEQAVEQPASAELTGAAGAAGAAGEAVGLDAGKPKRADARRNHDALLAAAGEVFAERGIEASLEEIARRANVGIGTLYRHFPTRDALNEAVYRREVETLCAAADELRADHAPDEALAAWMHRFAGYVAKKRGMAAALKSALGADNELFTYSRERIHGALNDLVTAAVASGSIRPDTDAEDVIRALSGICMASDLPGEDRTSRLIDLIVDGLRYRPAATAAP